MSDAQPEVSFIIPCYNEVENLPRLFQELFKVKADFAPDMDWNDEHLADYAAFISRQAREEGLHHFDRGAQARVIEYGARLREDQRKLSSRLRDIADVVNEANYWASKAWG